VNPLEYLEERVSKVVIDSGKLFNEGCRLLAHYESWKEELPKIVDTAWDTLLHLSIRNKQSKYTASVKLTFASSAIGKRIANHIGVSLDDLKNTLSLGDIMLEAFLQAQLIDIFREYDGYKAPYLVRIVNETDEIKPTLIGTSFTKPMPITSLFSDVTGGAFIKGWTDNKLFKEYLDKPFIKALETLRQQPWKLNTAVLTAARLNQPTDTLELVDKYGEIVKWNIHHENLKLPKRLKHLDGSVFLGKNDPKLQRLVSKYFEYQMILRKAGMVNKQTFYQEVACDYRGRIYYAESFLEFQGADLARSLFLFENEKKVSKVGFDWMLIHAAGCYNQSYTLSELAEQEWMETDYISYLKEEGLDTISVDKMTLKDRVNWSNKNIGLLLQTAKEKTVHSHAEKPYSLLAVCVEIAGYLRAKAKNLAYTSGYPIPIDGSNNGTQHLAAMSRDKRAGELVSLVPSAIQKDFYVAVGKELIGIMPDWFEEKQMPMKHIRKGIAKRGCMTRAYSAGRKKIAANMYTDMHVEGFTTKYNVDEEQCGVLAGNLINAINTVCAGPLKTAKFLQKIAEHELSKGRTQLTWHTPSGFPVVYKANLQHERKQRGTIRGIEGNKDGRVMHVIRVDMTNQETGGKVPCRRSFASGISPNFIHSMDAAHMSNTISAFGGSFAAVHDSFSSHADDIPFLQEVTKMTFVAQYDIENFFDEVKDMLMLNQDSFDYPNPQVGDLDIKLVADSDYFFC
jgi:DNA-directed RNA polymerase